MKMECLADSMPKGPGTPTFADDRRFRPLIAPIAKRGTVDDKLWQRL